MIHMSDYAWILYHFEISHPHTPKATTNSPLPIFSDGNIVTTVGPGKDILTNDTKMI